ncbi:hypothetical protein [Halorubrum vacuolatum]|uniref:Uncharacterized protein n=1 Tax=Halorubrum vacuolatum TaxID=63740 RepID=A0A238WK58_HALVU|nr:hypothetical protein [Halorubrum vacuolatum]SNR46721.1 hypothetical protein SAMN06264855_10871 [Halorubrum vacuolatum]
MTDSRTSEDATKGPNDRFERPPRYEAVVRWAEYIRDHPPEVWGPQQNAVVNGQIESAQAINLPADERKRVRSFADDVLGTEHEDAANGER